MESNIHMRGLVFLLFSILIGACAPSVHQLMRYEQTEQLKNDTLFFVVRDDYEEVALLEKYNQNKKAARLKKNIDRDYEDFISAIESEYNFSPYVIWHLAENDNQLPNAFYTDIHIYEEQLENGSHSKMAFQVMSPSHKIVVSSNRDYSHFRKGYKYFVRDINRKLHHLQSRGERALQQ